MIRRVVPFLLGLSVAMWPAAPAGAAWAGASAGQARAAATAAAAPGTTTASCNLLLAASVKVDWAASPSPWVADYEVRWGTNAAAPSQSAIVSGTTFSSPALGLGTWYFSVRSVKGAWRSAPANQVSRSIVSVLGVGLACA